MDWQAEIGDGVSVESHRLRASRRKGTIREVLGAPGHAYYRVVWEDGRESVFHPGPDAVLIPKRPRNRKACKSSGRTRRPRNRPLLRGAPS